jgi:hypothetical protein
MRPPWDRKKKALPRLPKGSIRVQVKVIEVGGGAASYRRSRSYTIRTKSFKETCVLLDQVFGLWVHAQPLRVVPPSPPPSGGLTPPPGAR